MSLIQCPECGAKISDKALTCTHCGYTSFDSSLPISVQETYEVTPSFCYDIVEWNPKSEALNIISEKENKVLMKYLGKIESIQRYAPGIAEIIQKMASSETVLVAKMDEYVKQLIEKGIYRFAIDKSGEILPTIRDAEGFVKQVRLEEMVLTPDFAGALNNLSMQATMAQILDEIKYIGNAIKGIHIELQNDRIALSESAFDKLKFASKIQDTRLREVAVLEAISSATEAKRILMRNFSENLKMLSESMQKSEWQLIFDFKNSKDNPCRAADAFQDLIAITNLVQAECKGFALIGECEAGKESLKQFKQFVVDNKLNQRDTLLMLNENTPQNNLKLVNEFNQIANKITNLDTHSMLYGYDALLLGKETKNEQ